MIAKYSILNLSYVSLNQECHVKEGIRKILDGQRQGRHQEEQGAACISWVAVLTAFVISHCGLVRMLCN